MLELLELRLNDLGSSASIPPPLTTQCSLCVHLNSHGRLRLTTILNLGGSMQSVSLPRQASISVPMKCPARECDASAVNLIVRSQTVATFRCVTCHFSWSARIDWLPLFVRQHLDALPCAY
jgi:hypothetical protein